MAPLSEWLELMLAEIARRQEELQLNAEEQARRARENAAAPATSAAGAPRASAALGTPTSLSGTAAAADALEPAARRRRRG